MQECIFCKIIKEEIPCMKLYEDDICISYLDINPDCDGHALIIPKIHYKDIYDIPNNTLAHIYDVSKIIMKKLEDKLNCDGFSLLQNNGYVQEVKHYHLHIKPFYKNIKSNELIKYKENIKDAKEIYELLKES